MMGFFTAPRICMGPGSIEQLSSLGAKRVLLVVDPAVAALGAERRVREELLKDGAQVETCQDVQIGPSWESLGPGLRQARALRPDWIVAVGGGSTIDTAKGLWLRYARPDLEGSSLTPLTELRLREHAQMVAVPTTSGSGSEVTWTAQFWDSAGNPVELASRELVPDWALLDPTLPALMPPQVTVDSGVDALAHALEALASSWANPISNGLARDAIGAIVRTLPAVLRHPEDLELRGNVHVAATMAGLAVSNAQSGLTHAIAHAVGPRSGLGHGRIVAILLPWVLEFNFASARDAYSTLGAILGQASVQNASQFADRFRRLNQELGVPSTLRAAGVDVDSLRARSDEWMPAVQNSTSLRANPRVPSREDLADLLRNASG